MHTRLDDPRLDSNAPPVRAQGGVVGIDANGLIAFADRAAHRMFGYDANELVGKPSEILSPLRLKSRHVKTRRPDVIERLIDAEIDTTGVRKDGSEFPASVTFAESQGELNPALDIVAIIREAGDTEGDRSRSRIAGAFSRAPLGMCVISAERDTAGTYLDVNSSFCELTGYTREQLLESSFQAITHPADLDHDVDRLRGLMAGEIDTWHGEKRYVRCDGTTLWAEVHVSAIRDAGGVLTSLVTLARDITQERRDQEAQRLAEHQMRQAFEQGPVGICMIAIESGRPTCFVRVNEAFCNICGYTEEQLIGTGFEQLLVEGEQPDSHTVIESLIAGDQQTVELERQIRRADGTIAWADVLATIAQGEAGEAQYLVAQVQETTERKHAEQQLRQTETRYRSLVERLPTITYLSEPRVNGECRYVSPQIEAILGYSPQQWREQDGMWLRAMHPDDREAAQAATRSCAQTGEFSLDYRLYTRTGELLWFHDEGVLLSGPDGEPLLHGFMLDITERKRYEERIAYLAFHDELTGLPNRAMFQQHLDLALARARRHDGGLAVLYLDLDRFKLINDSFGHAPGDELLRQIAGRLQQVTRAEDIVARHSGDEFLVLLADLDCGDDADATTLRAAEAVAAKIHNVLRAPFRIEGEEFFVDTSVGISTYPEDGDDADDLIRHADMAMYESKRMGQGGTHAYVRADVHDPAAQLSLASRLRRATERGEFVLLYQPIVDLESCRMRSVEALIRWCDPERGAIMPAEFIPLAEETGLIEEIGDWVIEEVCRQAAVWERRGLELPITFNVSLRQLRRNDFAGRLVSAAHGHGANPRRLVAEITESAVMRDPQQTREIFEQLHGCGVWTAIDDFGTGHSSLSRLMEVPVTALKIDRSFVRGIPEDRASASMVAGIVEIARGLNLVPLAEGIETEEQRRFLVEAGCNRGQGYRFSRPVPPDEIEFLHDRGPLGAPAGPVARRRRRRGRARAGA